MEHHYGEDLDCQVYIDDQRTPLQFRCQVKSFSAAQGDVRRLRTGDYSVRVSANVCQHWLLAYHPFLLIVYDRLSEQAHWTAVGDQLRARVSDLAQQTVTLRVGANSILQEQQAQVIELIMLFYSRLFKVHSEAVERTVFPVLMPGYRVLPLMGVRDLFSPRDDFSRWRSVSVHRDTLPAWTTSLLTLDGPFFSGSSFQVASTDLPRYSDLLTSELITAARPCSDGEWLAFVCTPLRFSIQRSPDTEDLFGKDLTGWWSYARIGSRIVSDHAYAFEPPEDFVRQIGRRARSWDGYYFVSPDFDVALQWLGQVAVTPADRIFRSILREHVLAQFIPWECPVEEVERLQTRLWKVELLFAPLPPDQQRVDSILRGAICTPMFSPGVGLIPQARDWDELHTGTARSRLAMSSDAIPGSEGSAELANELKKLVSHLSADPPDGWLVDGTAPEPGLPIDLSMRRIVVQRFRKASEFDPRRSARKLGSLRHRLREVTKDAKVVDVDAYIIESFEQIAAISVSWTPLLEESSAESVQRVLPQIVQAFDEILPRNAVAGHFSTSMDVLRYSGELYFEGDRMY